MKYIDSKSILINDSIALYNSDGSQDSYEPHLNIVETIHFTKLKKNGKEYELNLASNQYGDKTIYYKYGVEKGYETDRIESDFEIRVNLELHNLHIDLLFDKAKSML